MKLTDIADSQLKRHAGGGMSNPLFARQKAPLSSGLQILPTEQAAVEATVQATRLFNELAEAQQDPATRSRLTKAFVSAMHRCQGAIGSLRFYHQLNRQHRQEQGLDLRQTMATPESLAQKRQWAAEFRQSIAKRDYPAIHRQILAQGMLGWEGLLKLSEQYPDQHVYDDYQQGLLEIEQILASIR